MVSNGYDYVQKFDTIARTWETSLVDNSLARLPQARGGMGASVYFNGEFYVMGGETSTGANATPQHTYSMVNIYNPRTNTWRLGPDMQQARHGIYPVQFGGRIFVAGGGQFSSSSSSVVFEVYQPSN